MSAETEVVEFPAHILCTYALSIAQKVIGQLLIRTSVATTASCLYEIKLEITRKHASNIVLALRAHLDDIPDELLGGNALDVSSAFIRDGLCFVQINIYDTQALFDTQATHERD